MIMVGVQGLTYCVKDLALVQHLHRTTSTSISHVTMTRIPTRLPGNLQELLLRFWEVMGILGNGSGHASEQNYHTLPLSDMPITPDKRCRGANDDRHPCQSGCGGRSVLKEAVLWEERLTRMRAWERHSRASGMRRRSP